MSVTNHRLPFCVVCYHCTNQYSCNSLHNWFLKQYHGNIDFLCFQDLGTSHGIRNGVWSGSIEHNSHMVEYKPRSTLLQTDVSTIPPIHRSNSDLIKHKHYNNYCYTASSHFIFLIDMCIDINEAMSVYGFWAYANSYDLYVVQFVCRIVHLDSEQHNLSLIPD